MTDKIAFIWAKGTSYVFNWFGVTIPTETRGALFTIPGIGNTITFEGGDTAAEPLLRMLDPNIFDVYDVNYSASLLPGSLSLNDGVAKVKAKIQGLPAGQRFILGGYSQGAAVHSLIYRQGLQTGTTGDMEAYRSRFLGATMFGNPMRATDHRGAVGGTWSGSWDVPGSATGGHGCYPATGPFARLQSAESKWVEFVGVIDQFTCTGDSTKGQYFSAFAGNTLALGQGGIANVLAELVTSGGANIAAILEVSGIMNLPNFLIDPLDRLLSIGGGGHNQYKFLPPPNTDGTFTGTTVTSGGQSYLKPTTDTMYQTAVKYCTSLANEFARSPSVLPPTPTTPSTAGWTTTLIPPAA